MYLFLLLLNVNLILVSSFVLSPSTTTSKIQLGHAVPTTSTASITNYMLASSSRTITIPPSPSTLSLYATTESEARNETRNANNYDSDSTQQKSKKKDFTEVSRLRFMLNQLKGNMQESEMRAGAAERRVAMLQKQIRDNLQTKAPTNNGGDADTASASSTATMSAEEKAQQDEAKKENEIFLNQVKSLKGTIKQINKAMENFKKETEQKIADMNTTSEKDRAEWKEQTDTLQAELTTANDELKTARKESDHLVAEIKALEMHMDIKEQELVEESEKKLEEAKSQAQKVQYSLEVEKELLKEKLVASKERTDELLKDLEMTKIDMTQELITVKTESERDLEKAKKDLDIKAQDISVKKETIKMLVGERQSVRKLFRVQRYLIKARVKSRIGRIMGKSEE